MVVGLMGRGRGVCGVRERQELVGPECVGDNMLSNRADVKYQRKQRFKAAIGARGQKGWNSRCYLYINVLYSEMLFFL